MTVVSTKILVIGSFAKRILLQ